MTPLVALILLNAASTWGMVGVIWFVQLVHYPLFAGYTGDGFRQAMLDHQRRTTWVVAPLMLTEGVTSAALLVLLSGWQVWLGVGCVAVWAFSTAAVQMPLHAQMVRDGFDPALVRLLVRSNWVRTTAWTLHGLVCASLLSHV